MGWSICQRAFQSTTSNAVCAQSSDPQQPCPETVLANLLHVHQVIMASTLQCFKELILHIRSKTRLHYCHQNAETPVTILTDVKNWIKEILCVWIPPKLKKKNPGIFYPVAAWHGKHSVNSDLLGLKLPRVPVFQSCLFQQFWFSV